MFACIMKCFNPLDKAKIYHDSIETAFPSQKSIVATTIFECKEEEAADATDATCFLSNEITLDKIDDTSFLENITSEFLLIEIDFPQTENVLNIRKHHVDGMAIEQYDIILSDGFLNKSSFENGLLNGYGKIIHENGVEEIGFFIEGKLDKGKMTHPNKEIHIGFFKEGLLHGKGFREIPELKQIYKGNFEQGLLNGIGFLRNFDGTINKGLFKNNELDGLGVTSYPNGGKQKGTYKENVPHGICETTYIPYIHDPRIKKIEIEQYKNGVKIALAKMPIEKA